MHGDIREFTHVMEEARTIAREAGQPLGSAHLLLGFFAFSSPAELVLRSHRIDEETILARIREMPRENADVVDALIGRAREIALGTGTDPRALHLLIAIARLKGCAANDLLLKCGVVTANLAREGLSYVVGPLPRRFVVREQEQVEVAAPAVATVTAAPAPRGRQQHSSPPAARSSVPPARRGSTPPLHPQSPRTETDSHRASRIVAIKRLAEGLDDEAAPFALSPDEFPYLASLGRNLTELAAAGKIDPVIGREREIEEALDVLGKRRSNNPVLVGEPGVGKTAVVEGIALRLAKAQAMAPSEQHRTLIELDVAGLIAGTQLRGSLSEKLNGIKDEVRRAEGRVVVFIDEIHTLVGAGQTGEGAQDAANELKAALARGEFPCIGATTFTEFQRYFVQDPALERRFAPIRVDEPSVAEAVTILRGVASRYAQHHGVEYEEDAIEAAASLSARFVRDRCLPDKAVAVLDHAGSRAKREGRTKVTREDAARVVARMARLPEDRLLVSDAERILKLEESLGHHVIGHKEIISRVSHAVRRNFAGFSGQRPLASFIFLGPTGVGKTELARSLAEVVFGDDSLVRVDMSEFSESHSIAKLVGAPPGYVGFGEGGQLTEGVRRRPACVVLLDEIEKAHRDSQQLILQMLDEGHLTDGRGRRVDFTSTIVVLTSNLGSESFAQKAERTVGFGDQSGNQAEDRIGKALALARAAFPIELWNRIEDRLVFSPLKRVDLEQIALMLADRASARLFEDKRIRFELDATAVDHLLANGGLDEALGARPLRQTLARLVEAPLAERILRGDIQSSDRIRVFARRGKVEFDHLTVLEPSLASRSVRP
jgi:ATP-dependent Clp protease ATP-binding subunit ClpC